MVKLGKASVVSFAHFVEGWQGTDPRSGQELRFSPGFQPPVYPTGAQPQVENLSLSAHWECVDVDMLVSE